MTAATTNLLSSKKTAKKSAVKKSPSVKTKKSKVSVNHPAYAFMIKNAISTLKERKGSSRAAILKFIIQKYKVGSNLAVVNSHLRSALKRGVANKTLKQVSGVGASGSFRLVEHKVPETKSAKKPSVRKVAAKKSVPKKTSQTKSSEKKSTKTLIKSPKMVKKTKSPSKKSTTKAVKSKKPVTQKKKKMTKKA